MNEEWEAKRNQETGLVEALINVRNGSSPIEELIKLVAKIEQNTRPKP